MTRWSPDDVDLDILRLVACGLPVATVGRRLGVSERTVGRRLQAMSQQLGVSTTMELVVAAVRADLI